jgi:hypothetical protein
VNPLAAILNIGGTLIERLIPDKAAQEAAKAQLAEQAEKGDLDAIAGQLQVNLAEAQSKSIFVAGWRPFVGWVCGVAFAYAFVFQPFAFLILAACHSHVDPKTLPALDLATMLPVLLGMLGLGAMRTFDKMQGTGNGH